MINYITEAPNIPGLVYGGEMEAKNTTKFHGLFNRSGKGKTLLQKLINYITEAPNIPGLVYGGEMEAKNTTKFHGLFNRSPY